jgi:hypothetical protein
MSDFNAPSSKPAVAQMQDEDVRGHLDKFAIWQCQSEDDAKDLVANAFMLVCDPKGYGRRRSATNDRGASLAATGDELTHISGIARAQRVAQPCGDQRDMRVANIARTSPSAKFAHFPGDRVERRDHAVLQRPRKRRLPRDPSPDLRESRAWHEHIPAVQRGELEDRPDCAVVAFQSNERARIEHDAAQRRRCPRSVRASARSSESVRAPCSASQASTARSKPSARSLRRAASASQEDVGSFPAARRTARARSSSNEIASRATVIR